MTYSIGNKPINPQTSDYKLLETLRTNEEVRTYVADRIQGSQEIKESLEFYYAKTQILAKRHWTPSLKLKGALNILYSLVAQKDPKLQITDVLKQITYSPLTEGTKGQALSYTIGGKSIDGTHRELLEMLRGDEDVRGYVQERLEGSKEITLGFEAYYQQLLSLTEAYQNEVPLKDLHEQIVGVNTWERLVVENIVEWPRRLRATTYWVGKAQIEGQYYPVINALKDENNGAYLKKRIQGATWTDMREEHYTQFQAFANTYKNHVPREKLYEHIDVNTRAKMVLDTIQPTTKGEDTSGFFRNLASRLHIR